MVHLLSVFLELLAQPLHAINLGFAFLLHCQGIEINYRNYRQHQAKHQDHCNECNQKPHLVFRSITKRDQNTLRYTIINKAAAR